MKTLFINLNSGLAGEASYRSSAEHAARPSGKAPIIEAYGGARLLINTTPGKVYTFTFTLDKGTVPSFQFGARTAATATTYTGTNPYWSTTSSSLSNYSYSFTATTALTQLLFEKLGDAGTSRVFYLDDTKVVEEGSDLFSHYEAEVMQVTDYAPFGAPLPGRTYNALEDMNKVVVVEGTPALTGWSTPNSSTSVSNDAVKVTFTTTNTAAVSMSKTFSTTASKHYRLSFNADAATYTNVSVEIVGYGGNALSSATLNTGITHYQLDFTANDASTVVKVSLGTGTGTRTIYLDNVKLEEIKGDISDYSYAGAGGQMTDNEINLGIYTAEYWEYDSRLGRRWNVDPVVKAWESPYAAFSNNPICFIDPSGANAEDPGDDDSGGDPPPGSTPPAGPKKWDKDVDGDTFIADEVKEVVIRADRTATNTPKPVDVPRTDKWLARIWKSFTNWISTAWSHRGGIPIEGQGEPKEAPFGHGWPGTAKLPQEVLDARGAVTPALTNGPGSYKQGKPDVDSRIIPESVTQAENSKKQADAVHGRKNDSDDVTIHFSNGKDTSFRSHKSETKKITDQIIFGK